jgi:hypothetical protein
MAQGTCSEDGCDRPVIARGVCNKHYHRLRSKGPLPPLPLRPVTCSIDGCEKTQTSWGWCQMHYKRWQKYGDPLIGARRVRQSCKTGDCDTPAYAHGLCPSHYGRWYRHGDPLFVRRTRPLEERFWPRVNKDGPVPAWRPELGPCWVWTGGKNRGHYGNFETGGAHRFAYEAVIGPVPTDLQLDHLCRVRHCVNPEHLEPVTPAENMRRAVRARAELTALTCQ